MVGQSKVEKCSDDTHARIDGTDIEMKSADSNKNRWFLNEIDERKPNGKTEFNKGRYIK